MATTSPFGNFYQNILAQLKVAAPSVRYVDQDFGQLEHYDIRPAVSWPCALVDIDETSFTEAGKFAQMGIGILQVRIGLGAYSPTNNLAPDNVVSLGLQYYEIEQEVYLALQGFWKDNTSSLVRVSARTEKRTDSIRVRVNRFKFSMDDKSAVPATQSISRPNPTIVAP